MSTTEPTTRFYEALARAVADAEQDRADRADPELAHMVDARDEAAAGGRFSLADSHQALIDRARGRETSDPVEPSRGWPADEQLDALFAAAQNTKSQALRFDPQAPDGFQVLTPQEDQELIDALRLPEQRYAEDRQHLIDERDTARRVGDLDAAETAEAHLEVLAAERRLADRYTPETDGEERER